MICALTWGVLRADRCLTGAEIRFLRKYIGLSSKGFAKQLGVDHTSLSKYENGKWPVTKPMDRLIRMMTIALGGDLLEQRKAEDLRELVRRFEGASEAAPQIQPKLAFDLDTMSCQYA